MGRLSGYQGSGEHGKEGDHRILKAVQERGLCWTMPGNYLDYGCNSSSRRPDRLSCQIKEIDFMVGHGRDQQGRFDCTCCLTSLNEGFATADFVIKKEGRVWANSKGMAEQAAGDRSTILANDDVALA